MGMEHQYSKEKVASSQVERSQQRARKCCQSCCTTISTWSRILHLQQKTLQFQMCARRQRYHVPSQEPPLRSLFDTLPAWYLLVRKKQLGCVPWILCVNAETGAAIWRIVQVSAACVSGFFALRSQSYRRVHAYRNVQAVHVVLM